MLNWTRAALAAVAVLALAGCYVTKKPLITQANAAWPFAAGTAFKAYSWKEEIDGWEESGSGTVLRVADHYRLHPNPDEGQTADADDDMDFLVADLGGGYFALQAATKDDDAILLDIAKVDGDTIVQYVLMCEPEDKAFADRHIVDAYEHGEFNDTCTVSSLDQLRRAFDAKLARGMIPHAKYVVTH